MIRIRFGSMLAALAVSMLGAHAHAKKPDITIRVVTPFPAGHILADALSG